MKIIERTSYVLATAALLSVVAFAQAPSATAADHSATRLSASSGAMTEHDAADRVEARIADLHQKLHINAAQTDQWNAFAAVMRDNAKMVRATLADKAHNAANMSAVDDLRSYQQVAQAHVDGLAKLIPAFEALYATMSDHQKKIADTLFREPGHHGQRTSSN